MTKSPREKVLILGHGDSFVEVFAGANVTAKYLTVPFMESVAGEIRAEEYVHHVLPMHWRDIYWPVNRRLLRKVERLRPSDLTRIDIDRKLVSMVKDAFAAVRDDEGGTEVVECRI